MPTVSFAGSILPTLNASHIIGTITASATYVFEVDTGNMAGSDRLHVDICPSITGGTPSPLYSASWRSQTATPFKASPPFPVTGTTHIVMSQTSGSARWFPFTVISI